MDINDFSKVMINQSSPLPYLKETATNKELMKVSKEFESLFLAKLFKDMNKSATISSEKKMFDGGMAEGIFKDMLYDQYALESVENNSIGLAQMVYDSLINQKENRDET